jgi:DNA-binding CsgD family transcriptional regulator
VVDETINRRRPELALTPRELEVLQLISSGVTNAEAARRLEISIHAIKLGVSNRTEAAVAYLRSAELRPEDG